MEETIHTHESFGMIGLARFQTNPPMNLFGSAVKHGTAISLTIHTAEKKEHLSRHWYSARKPLIEVIISGNQLADLLTTMNVGNGVPCTIRHIGGATTPPCPEENPREVMASRVDDHIVELNHHVNQMLNEMDLLLNSANISKKKRQALEFHARKIKQGVGTNFKYMKRTLNEYTDDILTEAKGEFSAMVDSMIRSSGLEALRSGSICQIGNDEEESE